MYRCLEEEEIFQGVLDENNLKFGFGKVVFSDGSFYEGMFFQG